MRLQERDVLIMNMIYNCDGVMAVDHLWRAFWPGKTLRAVQRRVQKLCEAGYLARPTRHQYRTKPIPQAIVWLGWRGILHLAEQGGVLVKPPSNPQSEYQLKDLAETLRKHGFHWAWRPRWGKVAHDLRVIDFRLAVKEAVKKEPELALEEWLSESIFRSDMDVVTFTTWGKGGEAREEERGVVPDAVFAITDEKPRRRGEPFLARHLLELDMASHSNPSFGRDKVAPYTAYIGSPQYRKRFDSNSGRWLVVTTGRRRMRNLMRQTRRRVVGRLAEIFYFTVFDDVEVGNVLMDPIWWRVDSSEPVALFPSKR